MFVELEGTLEFLDFRCRHISQQWLPSWTPDFAPNLSIQIPELTWAGWQSLRGTRPGWPRDENLLPRIAGEDASVLLARGALLDRVTKVVEVHWDVPDFSDTIRQIPLSPKKGTGKQATSHPAVDDCDEMHETIWRTLIADTSVNEEMPCPGEYSEYYKELATATTTDLSSGAWDYHNAMQQATSIRPRFPCRRLLLFEKKFDLGLGPPESQIGDLLCLLAGYSLPVILRPCGDSFQFVGDVYVRGLMQGEGFSDSEPSQSFVIK